MNESRLNFSFSSVQTLSSVICHRKYVYLRDGDIWPKSCTKQEKRNEQIVLKVTGYADAGGRGLLLRVGVVCQDVYSLLYNLCMTLFWHFCRKIFDNFNKTQKSWGKDYKIIILVQIFTPNTAGNLRKK